MSKCSSCDAEILWYDTPNGKKMCVDVQPSKRIVISPKTGLAHLVDTYMPHWGTCPSADQHKGGA